MEKARILLVDDHPLFREALASAISAEEDLEVVGEATNGQQAVDVYQTLQPDVTVMDLFLPLKSGIEAIAEIVTFAPEARILVVTSSMESNKILEAVRAGAKGYLLKDASRQRFLEGLREVAQGRTFLPPDVTKMLTDALQQNQEAQAGQEKPDGKLTAREREIFALIGEGLSNREIAEKLFLSESTVRVHVYNILGKLGLGNRAQAILYAVQLINKSS